MTTPLDERPLTRGWGCKGPTGCGRRKEGVVVVVLYFIESLEDRSGARASVKKGGVWGQACFSILLYEYRKKKAGRFVWSPMIPSLWDAGRHGNTEYHHIYGCTYDKHLRDSYMRNCSMFQRVFRQQVVILQGCHGEGGAQCLGSSIHYWWRGVAFPYS
jgi:hypothetical protein